MTQSISEEVIAAVQKKMRKLPQKKERLLTKMETVAALRSDITGMQQKGYSLQEIAEYLAENGVKISAGTLRNYLGKGGEREAKQVDSV